ncbi:MAG: monovalent cation/H(+) antiporter subunit G [Propioniciclava sp.]|uniref:monovalent cation/H(+) antiporter subunit G n=1 Tax=Propioniciclava sp. TaxID=2038686 RepID=UPI0039E40933
MNPELLGEILDVVGASLLLGGAFFCLAAAVGIVRFPDVLTRLHAATKPQVFGLMLVLLGVVFTLRTFHVFVLGTLVVTLQILTTPVAGHMLARTAYRTDQWDSEHATVDELADDLAAAGFSNKPNPEDHP